jgi:hypothetical protein
VKRERRSGTFRRRATSKVEESKVEGRRPLRRRRRDLPLEFAWQSIEALAPRAHSVTGDTGVIAAAIVNSGKEKEGTLISTHLH